MGELSFPSKIGIRTIHLGGKRLLYTSTTPSLRALYMRPQNIWMRMV